MTNDNQIEMLEETIDKGITAKQAAKAEKAAAKAAEKAAKAAEKAAELAKAAEIHAMLKEQRVEELLAFNERYSNGPELNNNGETMREWAERVC